MALIENLVVALGLKAEGFNKGLKKGKQGLTDFEKSTAMIGSKLKMFGTAAIASVAGFLGLRSVVSNVTSAMAELDKVAKTSDKLGIATDQLIALRYASDRLTGMPLQSFDTALQRMIRRVSEASIGKGEGLGALKELGIDAKKLNALSVPQQMRTLADAFGKVANQSDKIRLAMKLFDSEGVAMVNLLRVGSDGLDEMFKRADRLGILFSRLDLAKIETANDEWADMKLAINGAYQALAIDLAPAIILFAREMTSLLMDTREWGSTFGSAADYAVKGMGVLADSLVIVTTQLRVSISLMQALGAGWTNIFMGDFEGAMRDIDFYLGKAGKAIDDFTASMGGAIGKRFEEELARIRKEFENLKQGLGAGEEGAGSDKRLFPAALLKGTRAAAEAAAKAGAGDRAVEYAKATVDKIAALNSKADTMIADMDLIVAGFGGEAGIV